jgi:hypothetical protein
MKMKKIYLAFGLAAGLTFTSCSLDTLPSTSLSEDIAITTENDLQNAVNGIGYLLSEDRMTYSAEYGLYADLLTNEFKVVRDYGQSSPIARYTLTKNDELVTTAYQYYYKAAANCNKALELSAKLEETDEVKNLKGQLYAWRGLIHFDLARMFAHIPTAASDVNAANSGIVLSTAVYEPDYKGPRTTLQQTYEQIINDLTQGMTLMGDNDNGVGYFNYYAALALRARANLYAGNYAAALADAKEVIADGGYDLYTTSTYDKVWSQEGSSESIFELLITTTHNVQRYSLGYYTDASGYPEAALADDGKILTYLKDNPDDVRSKMIKEQSVASVAGTHFFPAKYPGRGGQIYVNNPKIIRLSEVYLIAAEAELKGNNNGAAAAEYINAIEQNRIEGYVDVDAVTIDDVIFEYEKEFFAENQIAFAYWRNQKSVTNQVGAVVNYNDNKTILPIPQREIDYDPSLVQNPGY